jgi:Rrf2 family protein
MASFLPMTEATALGLHASTMAAASDGPVRMATMAESLSASEAHLSKVLQTLVKAGLLTSKRGPNGGYSLARPAEEIRLIEVYEAFEGEIRSDGCLFTQPVCKRVHCILGGLVERVRGEVVEYLRKTTLEEAASGIGR